MVLLRIVNDSSGGHDLSAPALFTAGTFPGGAAPATGKIDVASRQSRDVLFVPGVVGNYRVECTHFLHSLFGMSGKVVVGPGALTPALMRGGGLSEASQIDLETCVCKCSWIVCDCLRDNGKWHDGRGRLRAGLCPPVADAG
jgi:hypothetical protein